MKHKFHIFTLLISGILMTSCIKEKLENTYNNQEDKIDKYIESNLNKNENYSVIYNGGSARLITKPGEGEELKANGTVAIYYAGYIFKTGLDKSSLFSTNHTTSATESGWTLTDEDDNIMIIDLSEDELIPGLANGLIGVKAGEECQILFSGKYGFGKRALGIVPANSALIYKIWVESISNE